MPGTHFGELGEPIEKTQTRVRMAARALGRNDLGHAYGHVSARLNEDSFLVCAAKPMGLITPEDQGTVVPIDGPLPDGVLGEVRCHQQIYRRRKDVNGIARTFLRDVMTLSTFERTPKPRIGLPAILLRSRRSGTIRFCYEMTGWPENWQKRWGRPGQSSCGGTAAF